MTTTRIARVPYLNSAPFFRGLSLGARYELTDCVPRELGERASAGEVLAGLLPIADYFRLGDTFERLGRFGIAVRGRARSVVLFSRKPIRQLDGAVIAVTEETSTTAVLLRLVLEQRHRVAPASYDRVRIEGVPRPKAEGRRGAREDADALLLIGDEALRFGRTNTRYPFETDLAFEWWLWQHLPFVFAVWAIRKDADPAQKKEVELGLAKSLGVHGNRLEPIAEEAAGAFGIPAADLTRYLAGFIYRLGQPEEAGIEKFRELVNEHCLL